MYEQCLMLSWVFCALHFKPSTANWSFVYGRFWGGYRVHSAGMRVQFKMKTAQNQIGLGQMEVEWQSPSKAPAALRVHTAETVRS